jgi:hypothetical protein
MNNRKRVVAATLMLVSLASAVLGDTVCPVLPTVIFLSREANAYRPTMGAKPTMSDVGLIVEAARKVLKLSPYPSERFENIIILDEGENWFVSFHARGNGNVKLNQSSASAGKTGDSGYFLVDTNAGVYLDKKSLAKSSTFCVVQKPISCLPLISPMGERVQGIGFVAEPDDKQAK